MCVYIYIYIYICVCVCVCVCAYIHLYSLMCMYICIGFTMCLLQVAMPLGFTLNPALAQQLYILHLYLFISKRTCTCISG